MSSFERRRRRAGRGHRAQRRRQDDAAVDPRRRPARRAPARSARRRAASECRLGAAAAGALLEALGRREPRACSPAWSASPTPTRAVERMLEQTGLRERADEPVGRLSGGNRQRVNVALGLLADPPVLALDEPSAALDPGQRERLWEFIAALPRDGTACSSRPTTSARLSATPHACSCWPTAAAVRRLPRGAPARAGAARTAISSAPSSRSSSARSSARGASDGWLLRKDLLILRRSRLLVALLVVYPVAIALLIGLAISRAPAKPRVAIVDETPPGADRPGRRPAASTSATTPSSSSARCRRCPSPRARRPSRRSSRGACSPRS